MVGGLTAAGIKHHFAISNKNPRETNVHLISRIELTSIITTAQTDIADSIDIALISSAWETQSSVRLYMFIRSLAGNPLTNFLVQYSSKV